MFVVALALLASPPAPTALRLEDLCEGRRCPAYGPRGDWSDEVDRLLASPTCAPKGSGAEKRRGCAIQLGCAEYRFTRPWDLCRGVTIRGCGEGHANGGTTLTFAHGVDGLRTWYSVKGGKNRCPNTPDDHVSAGFVAISDVYLQGELRGGTEHQESTALVARTPVRIERVTVQRFGHALHVTAAHPNGNANGWAVYNLSAIQLGGWGVYIEGADANNGTAVGLNVAKVCRRAGRWDGTRPLSCWGVRDRSSFGTTFVAPHVAYLWDAEAGADDPLAHHPGYVTGESKTAVTLLLNPYEETGGRGSVYLGNTQIIGGISRPRTAGIAHWRGRAVGGALQVLGRGDHNGAVHLGDVGKNAALAVELQGDRNTNLRLIWDDLSKTWGWRAGGAGAGALAVTGYASQSAQGSKLEPGRAWIGRAGDRYEGPTNAVTRRLYGTNAKPPECDDTVPAGSTYRNQRPAAGEPVEWICVCAGTERPRADGSCTGGKRWLELSATRAPELTPR